jgi:hypothetical protein
MKCSTTIQKTWHKLWAKWNTRPARGRNFDQNEARQKFHEYLKRDLRFAEFDHDRLITRVKEALSNGRTLDLADPFLRPNGEKRPIDW